MDEQTNTMQATHMFGQLAEAFGSDRPVAEGTFDGVALGQEVLSTLGLQQLRGVNAVGMMRSVSQAAAWMFGRRQQLIATMGDGRVQRVGVVGSITEQKTSRRPT